MRAIIIAGGQTSGTDNWRRWVRRGDLVIGADGGAARALAWGLEPDLVIGDMDSLPDAAAATLTARGCQFVQHPRAKDETDLELALNYAAQQGAREIIVFGAWGGRLDHTLANVLLLALPSLVGISVRLVYDAQEVRILRGGEEATLEGERGDLVSLLPVGGDAFGVTTRGLLWALRDETLRFGFSRGVSNELSEPVAHVTLDEGYLLLVHGPAPED